MGAAVSGYVVPFSPAEFAAVDAVCRAARHWLITRGYDFTPDDHATALDAERAPDALACFGHCVARCGMPSDIARPVLPLLVEKCREALGDAEDARVSTMLEIHREWIGHADTDADDSGRTLHDLLSDYALELARAVDPDYQDQE